MESLNHIELPAGFGQTRGSEHEVWMSPGGTRVIKATHAGEFGRKFGPDRFATEAEYLERIRMMNAEFQIDWRIEGVNGAGGNRRIVTSQPLFAGDPPSHASIRRFLEKFGFHFYSTRFGDAWHRQCDGLLVSDAEPKNAVQSIECVIPFDFLIARPPAGLLELAGIITRR